jgi:exodeoxyribonuclease V alpha subunit
MGKRGVHNLNRLVENILQKNQLIKVTGAYYHDMPVMISENNYQLGLYNGDVGLVREEKGELRVWFEIADKLVSFIPAYISSASKNFAMTIHKSQGSEYKEVWISLPENDEDGHYTRELLYTAVTRAKQKVFINGSEAMILTMASRKLKRSSGVVERFSSK